MAIVKTEAYFNSSTGRHKIRALIWKEEELTPIGVFQIAHGMAEHIERYDGFARFLASNGFVVCGSDHLGHGKSVNSDEDYGYFDAYNGDKRLVDDLHILTKIMKKTLSRPALLPVRAQYGVFVCACVYRAFRRGIERRNLLRYGGGSRGGGSTHPRHQCGV